MCLWRPQFKLCQQRDCVPIGMVPMGVLIKSTNNFVLQCAPLRMVLETVTSPASRWLRTGTWTCGGLGRIESETGGEGRAVRGGGGCRVIEPRASDRSALVQDRRIVSTSRSLQSSVSLIETGLSIFKIVSYRFTETHDMMLASQISENVAS